MFVHFFTTLAILPLLTLPSSTLANPGSAHTAPNHILPLVINPWSGPFPLSTFLAYSSLLPPSPTPIDALVTGLSACEAAQCDGTVRYGGSPDEKCETTLDAMIMD